MGLTRITSDGITDGTIVNADINGSAAIAGSKLNTNFGSSGMTATGSCSFGNITISNVAPKIFLTDSDTDSDFSIRNMHGVFGIHDQTNSADRLTITSDGNVQIPADNKYLQLGASQDLNLYHDGSHSYITNATGALHIHGKSGENSIVAVPDGAVNLYYNNVKKFETTASGVDVVGNCTITGNFRGNDNVKLNLGNGDDLQIYHDGTNSYVKNNTGVLYLQGDMIRFINDAGNENIIKAFGNGAVELNYDGVKKFETTS